MSLNIWTHWTILIWKKLGYSTSLFDSLTISYLVITLLRACLNHQKRMTGFIRHSSLVTKQTRKQHTNFCGIKIEDGNKFRTSIYNKKDDFSEARSFPHLDSSIYQNLLLTLPLWVNFIDSIAFVTLIYFSLTLWRKRLLNLFCLMDVWPINLH